MLLASDGQEFYSRSTDIGLFLSRHELVHGWNKSDEEKAVDIRGLLIDDAFRVYKEKFLDKSNLPTPEWKSYNAKKITIVREF